MKKGSQWLPFFDHNLLVRKCHLSVFTILGLSVILYLNRTGEDWLSK